MNLLVAFSFRAILLDLHLPELSGLEILAWMHTTRPVMLGRVIVVTAMLAPSWIGSAEVKSARKTIVKPFDLLDVERELRACCGMVEGPGDQRPRTSRADHRGTSKRPPPVSRQAARMPRHNQAAAALRVLQKSCTDFFKLLAWMAGHWLQLTHDRREHSSGASRAAAFPV